MNKRRRGIGIGICRFQLWTIVVLMSVLLLTAGAAQAGKFTLNVVDQDGNPVNGFKWLLQEDTTFEVDPNNPATEPADLLSMSFHKSYHPLAKKGSDGSGQSGNTDGSSVTIFNVPFVAPAKRYYVSVLPYAGYSIGGAPVLIDNPGGGPGTESPPVTVVVNSHPIPTAQIAVFLFQDNNSINGAPDLPQEINPAVGEPGHVDWTRFNILLEEPAGRYGVAGGQVIQDAFGNPLGTSYQRNPLTNEPILGPDGGPLVNVLGDGTLHPDADGFLIIRNLSPGKYGIVAIPPTKAAGEAIGWQQSSTIEGTKVIDAWVKANEPPFFVEFGLPGPHVFIGFIKSTTDGGFPALQPPAPGEQVATISGTVTDMHMSRSPTTEFFSGRPFPGCWIGINERNNGIVGKGLYAEPCDNSSSFTIADVPPGSYQLAIFDTNLDAVIASLPFSVDTTGATCNGGVSCAFGEVPVFNWFHRINASVFTDDNENGFWDPGELGIGPESQSVTLRWRDGSVYQFFPTDNEGIAPFDEVFPFFHWLIAEVAFTNKKATGATFVIDNGGLIDKSVDTFPGFGELTPQPQCAPGVGYVPGTTTCDGAVATNPETGDNLSRTETGPVLTTAFQGFLGQTNVMQFGKKDYVAFTALDLGPPLVPPTYVGENGGISGIVFYATTRAEDEPQFAAAEEWEPGVPRVQVALYADGDILGFGNLPANFPTGVGNVDWDGDGMLDADDGIIDDVNQNGIAGELADVDNAPLGWSDPSCVNDPKIPGNECLKGNEDIDRNANGAFDYGDALRVVYTDSWDDNLPSGCQGEIFFKDGDPAKPTDCFDGLRNFNQIRPGVFDGGYAFDGYDRDRLPLATKDALTAFYDQTAVANLGFTGMLPADYIVEAATPPGYELLREEHKNVDFGDVFTPSPQALAATCVGDDHVVPRYLQMQTVPDATVPEDGRRPVVPAADLVAAPFAGTPRPLCDRKQVPLSAGQNAAADFFLMTDVPMVANVSGVILNDLANEFNPNSPSFGEKFAPPTIPVGFYDWDGNRVNRVYADQFGRFDAVLPSTYTADRPQPSGMSPNMLTACMNDAGPIPNPAFPADPDAPEFVVDPFFDPQYSQFCYTFQYMPAVATYLDTPVVPIAAFAGPGQFPVDCEQPTLTPMIASVNRRNLDGGGGPFALPGQRIRIRSMGMRYQVPNPEWDGIDLATKFVNRNYNFGGSAGLAELVAADGTRTPLAVDAGGWSSTRIFATVPGTVSPGEYQVMVTRTAGVAAPVESPVGVTLTVGTEIGGIEKGVRPNGATYDVWSVGNRASDHFATIQEAIGDPTKGQPGVAPGDLILVRPGVYDEMVIMWKPVKLQGWGAGAVTINARQTPAEKVAQWRALARQLEAEGSIDRLPGQQLAPFGFPALAEALFPTEEGAGVFVAGKRTGANRFGSLANRNARIDGFTIVGASTGGGIVANGYNPFLNISNNRLTANAGFYGGGIRVGHPQLSHEILGVTDPAYRATDPNAQIGDIVYDDAINDRIRIHHNQIVKNGGFNGAGGGISLHTGADAYKVQNNWICGNFSQGGGAGIGHLGRSRGGLIEDNSIIFNETFNQQPGTSPSGAGILIAGQPGLVPEAGTGLLLGPGSGDVTIDANLIRGNLAGAGDGGGVSVANVNGQEVATNLGSRGRWYVVNLYNNMIDNNVAGVAGGGVAIADSIRVNLRSNTVANNDSVSTGSQAFELNSPNRSTALPAGVISRLHSTSMSDLMSAVDPTALPGGRAAQWLRFSDPVLRDDIIVHNRSFYWSNFDDPTTPVIETGLFPANCTAATPDLCNLLDVAAYSNDLGVLSGVTVQPDRLNPRFSLLTDKTGYHRTNVTGAPAFVNEYFNEGRDTLNIPEFTTLQTAGAFDEGGNFIQVAFGPLSLLEIGAAASPGANTTRYDYHLTAGSAAINKAANVPVTSRLGVDFDNEPRPNGSLNDIGADEAM